MNLIQRSCSSLHRKGDQICSLELKLEPPSTSYYSAGDVISGCVVLHAGDKLFQNEPRKYISILLKLQHMEQTEVYHRFDYSTERKTHEFVSFEKRLVRSAMLEEGPKRQYEYRFEWKLPDGLPSSTSGIKGPGHNVAEIYCMLNATVVLQGSSSSSRRGSKATQDVHRQASKEIKVKAKAPPRRSARSSSLDDMQTYPIRFLGVFKRGVMRFICHLELATIRPGEIAVIDCWGENMSRHDTKRIVVKLVEHVFWRSNTLQGQTYYTKDIYRTVAQTRLEYPAEQNSTLSAQINLPVPRNVRDSYHGHLIQISHSMIVSVVTGGIMFTTTPRYKWNVTVVRPER